MNSLRDIVQQSPRMRGLAVQLTSEDSPQPLGHSRWDWQEIKRILVIRLRSIGDTVLSTPSLFALKRFVPHAQLDVLLEDWTAPVLTAFEHVDNVVTIDRRSLASRVNVARKLRQMRYDVVYNLHGGTTATLLTRATGARHRVGYASYQYASLHNHLAPSPLLLWGREQTHSVEQQLGLLGWTGVPITDRPPTSLGLAPHARERIAARLANAGIEDAQPFALVHPAAAFATKQWAVEKFAAAIEALAARNTASVVLVAPHEQQIAEELQQVCSSRMVLFDDLSLPEVVALAFRSRLFLGNDSGIAHIAAAAGVPSVVIFGSSNRAHWQPWAKATAEVVFEEMPCQPCHGYFCEKFEQPECIIRVPLERVIAAVDRILANAK